MFVCLFTVCLFVLPTADAPDMQVRASLSVVLTVLELEPVEFTRVRHAPAFPAKGHGSTETFLTES